MNRSQRLAHVREAYARLSRDPAVLSELCSPVVAMHIAGNHPLSGDHLGIEAATRFYEQTRAATDGLAALTVLSVCTDTTRDLVVAEISACHGRPTFQRIIVHVLRLHRGRVVELWEKPFESAAEDDFWNARLAAQMPSQRVSAPAGRRAAPTVPAIPVLSRGSVAHQPSGRSRRPVDA